MTLTEFLLARIAEDEADARAAIDPERPGTHWQWVRNHDDVPTPAPTWDDGSVGLRTVEHFPTPVVGPLPAFVLNHVEMDEPRAAPHIARHDPARVLAECEAKRLIVHRHHAPHECPGNGPQTYYRTELGCPTVRDLALPYADHPDYDEAWRP